jgi:hypothetical protein
MTFPVVKNYIMRHFGNDPNIDVSTYRVRHVPSQLWMAAQRKVNKMASLKSKVTKLAYENPELRPHLLPLLKEAAFLKAPRNHDLYLKISTDTMPKDSIWGVNLYLNENGYLIVNGIEPVSRGPWRTPSWLKDRQLFAIDWLKEWMGEDSEYREAAIPGRPFTTDFRSINIYLEQLRQERS